MSASSTASTPAIFEPRRPSLAARWVSALAVLAVAMLVVFGGFIVTRGLARPVGPPVIVGEAVAVQPLSGWEEAAVDPIGETPRARLTRGTASLDVVAPIVGPGDPSALLTRYVTGVLEPETSQLEVSEEIEFLTLPTGDAARVTYAGRFDGLPVRIAGEVTVAVSPEGMGVVFDAWGPQDVFGYSLTDTETMVRRARDV